MELKKNLLGLGAAALIGLNSLFPINAKADNFRNLENRINPIESSFETLEDFSENKLFSLPQKYANWYLADLLMVLMHEQGHYDEAYSQRLEPLIYFELTPLWVNGYTSGISGETSDENDNARRAIAGFVNTGNIAEYLKDEILMGRVSEDEIKFKSMLALACELNLPFYLAQHYAGTAPNNNGSDIENFSSSSGISPETMAISSGVHMLVNAPYIYYLTKNALGSNPKVLEAKPYFLDFRYDGDSYMLYLHLDIE